MGTRLEPEGEQALALVEAGMMMVGAGVRGAEGVVGLDSVGRVDDVVGVGKVLITYWRGDTSGTGELGTRTIYSRQTWDG